VTASASNGVASIRSAYTFADTVQQLVSAFTSHGLKIFAMLAQRAEAAAVGLFDAADHVDRFLPIPRRARRL
jgi:uncharacterized protein (DUF302 family)